MALELAELQPANGSIFSADEFVSADERSMGKRGTKSEGFNSDTKKVIPFNYES